MSKYNTESGYIMAALNYRNDVVERMDQLAFWLYTIPVQERNEIIDVIKYQFGIDGYENKKFDEILANRVE